MVKNSLPATVQPVFAQLIEALRQALETALSNVFLTGAILMVVALLLTFFLKELPLRTTVRKETKAEADKQREASFDVACDAD